MRRLMLIRHGKSDWKAGQTDFERPLAARGRRNVPRVMRFLLEQNLTPGILVSSPATRAKQTAALVLDAVGEENCEVTYDPRIYAAELDVLLDVLAETEPRPIVMLIGHNQGLESLFYYLAYNEVAYMKFDTLMPTAATACLQLPDDWIGLRRGCAKLITLVRAKEPN